MRPGDNALELTNHLDMQFSQFHFAHADVEDLSNVIDMILKEDIFHADFYQFVAPGQCVLIESTCKGAARDVLKSMILDAPALAAQLSMSTIERKRHMKAFWRMASLDEREIVLSGEHDAALRRFSQEGVVWSSDEPAASISWKGASGAAGAVTIVARVPTNGAKKKLKSIIPSLSSYLHSLG